MLYFTKNKSDCMGCSACMASCPVQCISMKTDKEGFLYPVSSDKCIHCGKCKKICPLVNENGGMTNLEFTPRAFCAVTKDKSTWQRSTSGGAFSEICRAFGDSDTIICGAAWNGLQVHHICVHGVDQIAPLCKSKYVASSPENVFSEILVFLNADKKVIFCGTPCQVTGLRKYLGKDYDNLLFIDLICHGVGSPSVFNSCVEYLSEQFGNEIVSYEFRAKRNAYQTDYMQKIGMHDTKEIYIRDDPYIQLFLSQNCLRPSCGGNCRFRNEHRQGDITIADFKGLIEIFPDMNASKRNYSTIIINTVKGDTVMLKLEKTMVMRQCSIDNIKKYNPLFYRQTWCSDERDEFFKDYIIEPRKAIQKWCTPAKSFDDNLRRKIWRVMPESLRRKTLLFMSRIREVR